MTMKPATGKVNKSRFFYPVAVSELPTVDCCIINQFPLATDKADLPRITRTDITPCIHKQVSP